MGIVVTAGEVVEAARDYHPGFRPSVIPDGVMLRQLRRLMQELMGTVATEAAASVSIANRITQSQLRAALETPYRELVVSPAFISILPNIRIEHSPNSPETQKVYVTTIEAQYELDNQGRLLSRFPAVAFKDDRVRFTDIRRFGAAESGWEEWTGDILYDYVPMLHPGQPIRRMSEQLELPEGLHDALIVKVAAFMALRIGDPALANHYEGRVTSLSLITLSEDVPGSWGTQG